MFFGFARGGTVGGFIGFILGYIVEEMLNGNIQIEKNDPFKTQKHGYNTYQKSLLILISETVKADGYINKEEIYFIKDYLLKRFGSVYADMMLKTLKQTIDTDYNVIEIANTLRFELKQNEKIDLLTFLFGLTSRNKQTSLAERILLEKIAINIGLTQQEYHTIFQQRKQIIQQSKYNNPYAILEIDSNATDEEVKKAYRRLVLKYHPDKFADDEIANEKFNALAEAYQWIKKQRNIR